MLRLTLFLSGLALVSPLPAEEPGDTPADISRKIDAHLAELWEEHGLEAAPPADDATFLRRTYLDLVGRIPTPAEARAFLADKDPDKRARLVKKLLAEPAHSAHKAEIWRKAILPNDAGGREAFEAWLFQQFQQGTGWDQIAREVISPTTAEGLQGAGIFQNSLESKPEKLATATARGFLGLQIGCAECHNHPFAAWKREEFWGLAAFFADLSNASLEQERFSGRVRLLEGGLGEPPRAVPANPGAQPSLPIPDTTTVAYPMLPGTAEEAKPENVGYRQFLADWMAAEQNPWFARATVNRAWWQMFGRGLVEPVDDLTEWELAPTAEVLTLLANDFATHQFDLRRLYEIIAGTQAYQLASGQIVSPDDVELFQAMSVRSLTASQIFNCLARAGSQREMNGQLSPQMQVQRAAFINTIEAPTQKPTEFQAGIPQMLSLLHGPLVERLTNAQTGDFVAGLIDAPFFTDRDRIELLYLATLTRQPSEAELKRATEFFASRRAAGSQGQEVGDLFWALLNSSEFLLNH